MSSPDVNPHNPYIPSEGEIIDKKYQIVQCIGRGGNAPVYEAGILNSNTSETVALKYWIEPKPTLYNLHTFQEQIDESKKDFESEVSLLAGLTSPYIAPLLDHGLDHRTDNENPYFTMPIYPQGNLAEHLAKNKSLLPTRDVIIFTHYILSALEYVHGKGIIHLDTKPGNVMLAQLDPNNSLSSYWCKLIDFGISIRGISAKSEAAKKAVSQRVYQGTPQYAGPEQFQGFAWHESDIYAVSVATYQGLTGEHLQPQGPFGNTNSKDIAIPRQRHAAVGELDIIYEVTQEVLKGVNEKPEMRPSAGEHRENIVSAYFRGEAKQKKAQKIYIFEGTVRTIEQDEIIFTPALNATTEQIGNNGIPDNTDYQNLRQTREVLDDIAKKQLSLRDRDVAYTPDPDAITISNDAFASEILYRQAYTISHNNPYPTKQERQQIDSHLDDALKYNPENMQAWLLKAKLYHTMKEYGKAVTILEQAIKIQPTFEATVALGTAFFEQKNYRKAEKTYKKALALDPTNAEVYVVLGEALRRQEKIKAANQAFDQALDINPIHIEAICRKGQVQESLKHYAYAFALYRNGLSVAIAAQDQDMERNFQSRLEQLVKHTTTKHSTLEKINYFFSPFKTKYKKGLN